MAPLSSSVGIFCLKWWKSTSTQTYRHTFPKPLAGICICKRSTVRSIHLGKDYGSTHATTIFLKSSRQKRPRSIAWRRTGRRIRSFTLWNAIDLKVFWACSSYFIYFFTWWESWVCMISRFTTWYRCFVTRKCDQCVCFPITIVSGHQEKARYSNCALKWFGFQKDIADMGIQHTHICIYVHVYVWNMYSTFMHAIQCICTYIYIHRLIHAIHIIYVRDVCIYDTIHTTHMNSRMFEVVYASDYLYIGGSYSSDISSKNMHLDL